jgi:hypothetical protein
MPQSTQTRRKQLIFVITTIAVVFVTAVGIYGLINGRDRQESNQARKTAASSPGAAVSATPLARASATAGVPMPARVVESADPERFARGAAIALFDWDTTVGYQPADLAEALVSVGDPTGVETGLASDVRSYLPTNYDWNYLRTYQTKQWLTIKRAYVPDQWGIALAQAKPGQLRPGTVAYTITGIRHRSGIWLTQPISTHHFVAFTLIITCRPTFTTCRLLRVGKLNSALS